ncbi:MAG: hypothetical protein RLY43_2248, partial [Bacteroidota bacterium]
MNIFIIHQSHNDSYKNHQMVKELFPGDGKVLFQKLGNKITVLTDIPLAPEFKDNFEIENRGNVKQPADCIPFSIRLNPVKANKRKRYPIREEEIEEWVNNKLSNLGFEILYKTISKEGIDI